MIRLRRGPSAAAKAAIEAARRSGERADRDLAEQRRAAAESEQVAAELRRHNEANGFSEWLARHLIGGGA
jgi:hypothetical protein